MNLRAIDMRTLVLATVLVIGLAGCSCNSTRIIRIQEVGTNAPIEGIKVKHIKKAHWYGGLKCLGTKFTDGNGCVLFDDWTCSSHEMVMAEGWCRFKTMLDKKSNTVTYTLKKAGKTIESEE